MATGSQNTSSQWDNPYGQEETPAELKKRKRKEAKEKEAKEKEAKEREKREAKEREREAKEREREAREREKEARRKEVKEKETKKKEANKKLKKQKHGEGNSSDKHSQGQPHNPDTTDRLSNPNIPVDLDTTWAEFTGEGRMSSALSDSPLSPSSTQKMESVSVMPNKEVFLILPEIPGGISQDDTESDHLSSDHEMKQQLEKEKESDHPSTSSHLQTQKVDKGDTSLEFSLVNEKAKLVAEKLELETQHMALKEDNDMLKNKVENFTKQNKDLSLELSQTKNELQYTKESMEKEKQDALNALSLVETEKATLVTKLQLDLQTAEAVKIELQNDKEYWSRSQSFKEEELKEKLASVQKELTKATATKAAIQKEYIRVHAQYEEQQKSVDRLKTELSTAQEGMKLRDITIGELNGRIKERTETRNIQLQKDKISLKEKEEEIQHLQHKNQVLKEDMKKRDEELLNAITDYEEMKKDFERISKELEEKANEIDNHATELVVVKEQTEESCKEGFEKDKMEFQRKLHQEQDEINDIATECIAKLERDLKQKEEIITRQSQELERKEQMQGSHFEGEEGVHLHTQSTGGAGASPHTSLSEEGKKLVDLYQQVAAKDDKIADLEKQLHVMTMESTSLKETKKQLEQMMQRGEGSVQHRTVTPDHMALIAQMDEYDKALQDIKAEKRAMKRVEAKNIELVAEVDRLKQELLQFKKDAQSGIGVSGALTRPNTSEEAVICSYNSLVGNSDLVKEQEEAKKPMDIVNEGDKLQQITAEYEDLLKYTKGISQALKEREEHINKQSTRIAQLRKEAEYYQSENGKLAALNKLLDDGGYQLQEEASTAQKSLFRVKNEVSEVTQNNEELQRSIRELELTIESKNKEIEELNTALDQKHQRLVVANNELKEIRESAVNEVKKQHEVSHGLQVKIQEQKEELELAKKQLQNAVDDNIQITSNFNAKQRVIDDLKQQLQHEVLSLQNELELEKAQAQLYKEDFLNERSDRTKAHEEYTEDIIQYKATIKQLKDDLGKYASTITQLEKVKRSLRENEDVKKNWDEERAGIDQQLRAYKRQVDELRRQLTEEKENKNKLQESLDKKTGVERKITEYNAKLHDLQARLTNEQKKVHDLQAQCADELKSKDHIMGGVQTLQQQIQALQQQLSETNRKYQEEMEKMRNANMRLQHKLRESWDVQVALEQELIVLRQGNTRKPPGSPHSNVHQPQTHVGENQVVLAGQRHHEFPLQTPEQATSQEEYRGNVQQPPFQNKSVSSHIPQFHAVPQPQGLVEDPRLLHHQLEQQRLLHLQQQSKQEQVNADLALKELEDAKRQRNQSHQLVSRHLHSTNVGIGSRTNIGQGQTRTNVEMESQRPHQQVSDEIPENPILYGVDEDIQKYADDIRRMTQPPQTQEFTTIEDTSIPYDPNLVCPKCGKRYRVGEIQKLGRHVNEFCTAK